MIIKVLYTSCYIWYHHFAIKSLDVKLEPIAQIFELIAESQIRCAYKC